jgi:DNA-binding transcriptional LysR family regulator
MTGTAAEAIVAEIFRKCGLEIPRRGVVASVQMHNALLAGGRYLAMRATSVVRFGGKHPSVKVLPVKLPVLPGPVGITTLKGRMISPVARLFIDCVREVTKPLAG